MLRSLLLLLLFVSSNAWAKQSDLELHSQAIADQRIAIKLEFFDGEILNILIAKNVWVRFLSEITWVDATQRSEFRRLSDISYNKGVYILKNLPGVERLSAQKIEEFRIALNHYLVVFMTAEMLGYKSFEDFKLKNINCDSSEASSYISCQLNSNALVNVQHASYIMATNGYLIHASGYLDFLNVQFIGKADN